MHKTRIHVKHNLKNLIQKQINDAISSNDK
jgi:hypothetical protein